MLLDVAVMALFLAIGNVAFWHFDPRMPLWRRLLKVFAALAITAIVSYYFGRTGVVIWFGICALPLIYIHEIWLPRRKNEPPEEFEKGMNTVVLPQLRAYSAAGGQILFGTDVGYIEQFDTSEEFEWMSRAGMSFQQILASLTTNPAQRFGYSTRRGRIAAGMDGDLVVLRADPAQDATAFSKVRYTILGGKVIYSEK
jgi:hypothetical protein